MIGSAVSKSYFKPRLPDNAIPLAREQIFMILRTKSEAFHIDYLVKSVKHPASLTVWECMLELREYESFTL